MCPSTYPDAILAALSPVLREALDETIALLGIEGRWWRVPVLRGWVELAAWVRISEQIQDEEGCSLERARISGGLRLGLNDESLARRLRSQRAKAKGAEDSSSMGASEVD